MLVSNPQRLAVLKDQDKKVQLEKIYKTQEEFLDSDEESLNSSVHSQDERSKKEVEIR